MRTNKLLLSIFLAAFFPLASIAQINAFQYSITKEATGAKAAVVSAHPLASEAGLLMLRQGGNAVDAAIAAQLALAVVYPTAGNIGGGGFMLVVMKDGKKIALDYREKAPAAAHRDMYLDEKGNPQLSLSQDGHLAAGVPGTIAGLFASHKYAKLPFTTLIQPAIDLAAAGFAITEAEANGLNRMAQLFIQNNTQPTAFVKSKNWRAGDTLVQNDLANTLKRIQTNGMKGFYEGETAQLIVAEMKRKNGIISLEDLKNYEAKERTALLFNYKGHQIVSMPLPSSGGIILRQMLGMIEPKKIQQFTFQSKGAVQLMVEAERRAFADRAEFLGDPDFVRVPVKKLTSTAYLKQRMADFNPNIAGTSLTTKAGNIKESEETTHLSVVDAEGNAVSVTTTLNGGYGSKTVVGGAGFILNNEMDDFSVKPGVPNMYGAVGNEKNAIAANKRMLSSMTPTIVLKNSLPYLVVGTPGGTTIPTSVFQSIVNIIDFKLSASMAVNAPKFHHQWLPDVIFLEKGFNATTQAELEKIGYKITPRGAIGRTELILFTSQGLSAIADNRGDDAVAFY